MSLEQFLQDEEWDAPFFKKLGKNDTSDEEGNQGGPLITKDMKPFLPTLPAPSQDEPTPSHSLKATLLVNGVEVDRVVTRYQSQSRGATRRPENRITHNIGALHGVSHTGDYLIFQRHLEETDRYRLLLVSRDTADHKAVQAAVNDRKSGPLGEVLPVSFEEIITAENDEVEREQLPFILFDPDASTVVTKTVRIARTVAFRNTLLRQYDYTCCVCGSGLRTPSGLMELEAAHIIPRGRMGTNDARNGLTLCKRHHWAFDNGLFGITPERRVYVPEHVLQIEENAALASLEGVVMAEAATEELRANPEALAWHMDNVVLRPIQQDQA